jgi:hypothetical protein
MANNEFLVNRVVKTAMSYPSNTASTFGSPLGVYIPTGAVVTGVTINHTAAPTVANQAGTYCLYVSTDIPLIAITALTDIGGTVNIPQNLPLLTTAGMYISKGGALYLKQGVSNGTSVWTYAPDVYVGYLKA